MTWGCHLFGGCDTERGLSPVVGGGCCDTEVGVTRYGSVPKAVTLSPQLGPWLAVEIPDLISKGLIQHKDK